MAVPFQADSFTLTEDGVGLYFTTELNPNLTGFTAPPGSILISPGKIWVKSDTATTAWAQSSTTTSQSLSFATTTINYTLSDKILILVDTINNPISIFLPIASTVTNKVFHIKWKSGKIKNKVTIQCATAELLDGYNIQILGEIGDSLEIISLGNEWVII